jgi:hypothetical protein
MAIGVFIAPNLLYWEALSSEVPDKARFSHSIPQTDLPASDIPPSLAISGLDDKRIFSQLEKFVPVSCATRYPATRLAQVNVEDSVFLHFPLAGKLQNELPTAGHLT